MSKTKAQLENELAEARHLLAEAQKSRSTETAADTAPPTWLQQFLSVQSESQKQMQQLLCQLTSSPGPAPSTTSGELTPHRSVVDQPRRPKADAQKPPTLHVGLSLAEFCKWRKQPTFQMEKSLQRLCGGVAGPRFAPAKPTGTVADVLLNGDARSGRAYSAHPWRYRAVYRQHSKQD